MAFCFSFGVSVSLCIFILNAFNAYAQLFPNEFETAHGKEINKVVESEVAGESIIETTTNMMTDEYTSTESMISIMKKDLSSGTTPKFCTPAMSCAFQPIDTITWQYYLEDVVFYCLTCTEGYECRFFQEDMYQKTNVYTCQRAPETTETVSSTTEMTPPESTVNSGIQNRHGSVADIHEL